MIQGDKREREGGRGLRRKSSKKKKVYAGLIFSAKHAAKQLFELKHVFSRPIVLNYAKKNQKYGFIKVAPCQDS